MNRQSATPSCAQVLAIVEAYLDHPHPRVRLGAVRVLGAIPTGESFPASKLNAATKNEGADPFFDFAAWQSINDLAKPWTEAIASGAWKTEGQEKQLEWMARRHRSRACAGTALTKILDNEKIRLHQGPVDRPHRPRWRAARVRPNFSPRSRFSYGPDCWPRPGHLQGKNPQPQRTRRPARHRRRSLAAARDRGVQPEGELVLGEIRRSRPGKPPSRPLAAGRLLEDEGRPKSAAGHRHQPHPSRSRSALPPSTACVPSAATKRQKLSLAFAKRISPSPSAALPWPPWPR